MGELTEKVKALIMSLQITSASPGHINEPLQVDPSIDLDELIPGIENETDFIKDKKDQKNLKKTVEGFDRGQVGEIQRMASNQFGNIKGFAENPVQFMFQTVFKKFAKGAGVVIFALLIFEAVKWIISELLKPGRLLDLRFKRNFRDEILQFRSRENQQKLKQGFSNIIITTEPRLRGGQGQTYNTLDRVRTNSFPTSIGMNDIQLEASGVSISKNKGSRKRSFGGSGA